MIVGLRRFKESQSVMPKISIILFNMITYGYFCYLIMVLGVLNIFNALTIGIAILVPINMYLVSASLKDFSSKRKSHVGTLDFFMLSLNISKKSIISEIAEEIESSEDFKVAFTVIYLFSIFLPLLLSIPSLQDDVIPQAIYFICLMVIVNPVIALINLFFNYKIFNQDELKAKDLSKIDKIEDILIEEKDLFKTLLFKKINKNGSVKKSDVLDAYYEIMLVKNLRMKNDVEHAEQIALENKIEKAKNEYDFLRVETSFKG